MPKAKRYSSRPVDVGSLARGLTDLCIKRLQGLISGPKVENPVRVRAIEIVLDRGFGKVSQEHKHAGTAEDGSHQFVVRHIYEGKPKGEK